MKPSEGPVGVSYDLPSSDITVEEPPEPEAAPKTARYRSLLEEYQQTDTPSRPMPNQLFAEKTTSSNAISPEELPTGIPGLVTWSATSPDESCRTIGIDIGSKAVEKMDGLATRAVVHTPNPKTSQLSDGNYPAPIAEFVESNRTTPKSANTPQPVPPVFVAQVRSISYGTPKTRDPAYPTILGRVRFYCEEYSMILIDGICRLTKEDPHSMATNRPETNSKVKNVNLQELPAAEELPLPLMREYIARDVLVPIDDKAKKNLPLV